MIYDIYTEYQSIPLLLCMSFSDCKVQMRNEMRLVTCDMCAAYSECHQHETVELTACCWVARCQD